MKKKPPLWGSETQKKQAVSRHFGSKFPKNRQLGKAKQPFWYDLFFRLPSKRFP